MIRIRNNGSGLPEPRGPQPDHKMDFGQQHQQQPGSQETKQGWSLVYGFIW